jgi:hypothetical protein
MFKRLYNLWKLATHETNIVLDAKTALVIQYEVGKLPPHRVTESAEKLLAAFKELFPNTKIIILPVRSDGVGKIDWKTIKLIDETVPVV